MTINRHNYEEYFLLYTDNELSVAEKNMVDAFVAANPDLGEELLMLQQSVLKPDTIEFSDKQSLVKAQPIDAAEQEKLLLLLDNELSEKDKKEITALISTDSAIQQEWELLQQTKLSHTDTILFENKPVLYRKETKVVAFPWRRAAAAAILIGLGLWGTVSYINKTEQRTTGTETVNNAGAVKEITAGKQTAIQPVTGNTVTTETATTIQPVNQNQQVAGKPAVITKKNATVQITPATVDNKEAVAVNEEKENREKEENIQDFNKEESNKKIFANVSPETNPVKTAGNVEIITPATNEFAVNTSLSNPDKQSFDSFDDDDDNKPKKTKLGGFFKKLKRVIERKTKIKTGSSDEVKIANMSFAMN